MTSLLDQVPVYLLNDWEAKAAFVRRAAWAAPLAAPWAIARAEPVTLAELPAWMQQWAADKYRRELGEVPPLRRLRPNQRWLETQDDPLLPAGLYEAQVRWLYERLGWAPAAYYWLGLRNRAYSVAHRFRFWHRVERTEYRVFGDGSMQPFVPGEWLCVALVDGEPRAFEYSRTWDYTARGEVHRRGPVEEALAMLVSAVGLAGKRGGQYRMGWKLRPLARAAAGLEPWPDPTAPSAIGQLQVPSWRPLQSLEG
jgi:hypothetical protein